MELTKEQVSNNQLRLKDRFFSFLEVVVNSIKYTGLFKSGLVSFHYIKCKFFSKSIKGNTYKFDGLKIKFVDIQSLNNMFFELFGLNVYFFRSKIKNPIVIDIGANIGDSVVYFKWIYPNSQILAFEPNPIAYNLLKDNIRLNKFKNVQAFNIALGNEDKFVNLYDNNEGVFNSATTNKQHSESHFGESQKMMKVKMKKISNVSSLLNLEKIDLLKIDIEGGEGKLFEDMGSILSKTTKVIVEFHLIPNIHENSFDKIIQQLHKYKLTPSIIGFYRNDNNVSNQLVFLIVGDR